MLTADPCPAGATLSPGDEMDRLTAPAPAPAPAPLTAGPLRAPRPLTSDNGGSDSPVLRSPYSPICISRSFISPRSPRPSTSLSSVPLRFPIPQSLHEPVVRRRPFSPMSPLLLYPTPISFHSRHHHCPLSIPVPVCNPLPSSIPHPHTSPASP